MPGGERIGLRVPEQTIELIRRAAEHRKMSLTAFMLAAAEALAKNVLKEKDQKVVGTSPVRAASKPVQKSPDKFLQTMSGLGLTTKIEQEPEEPDEPEHGATRKNEETDTWEVYDREISRWRDWE